MNTDLKYVPESQPIHSLLQDLKASPNMMAFVVNEYGGIVGFVTVEDLVEEIVGEFTDERDSNHQIRKIDEDVIECDGRTTIDNLNDSFDLGIPTGDYETVSGYILDRVKRLPAVGTQIDTESIIITVTEANDRAIKQIRIRKNHVWLYSSWENDVEPFNYSRRECRLPSKSLWFHILKTSETLSGNTNTSPIRRFSITYMYWLDSQISPQYYEVSNFSDLDTTQLVFITNDSGWS